MSTEESEYSVPMREALRLAETALRQGDVPVGAVLLDEAGNIVGRGWNTREAKQDPLGHAELMAIREASATLGSWRLNPLTLVVTLEPCVMCAGALVAARVGKIVFGAYDSKAGGTCSLYGIPQDPRLNHRIELAGGVLEEECQALLQGFFQSIREQGVPE